MIPGSWNYKQLSILFLWYTFLQAYIFSKHVLFSQSENTVKASSGFCLQVLSFDCALSYGSYFQNGFTYAKPSHWGLTSNLIAVSASPSNAVGQQFSGQHHWGTMSHGPSPPSRGRQGDPHNKTLFFSSGKVTLAETILSLLLLITSCPNLLPI